MNLSAHFTLHEALFSSTAERLGIDNTASDAIFGNLQTAAVGMEAVREILGKPIHIDSWYRCQDLNKAVGGAVNSAHLAGFAVDFICPAFGEPVLIVAAIAASGLMFDQLIQEGRWVHISFDPRRRGELLTAHFGAGGATYSKGA